MLGRIDMSRRQTNGLFIFCCFVLSTTLLCADGAYFSHRRAHLTEPSQKAVITWDGTTETMILSSRVQSRDLEALEKAAWIVPVISTSKPEVTTGAIEAFEVLTDFLAETYVHHQPSRGGLYAANEGPGVTAHERLKLGIYDVTILEATSASKLMKWLKENGYFVPSSALAILQKCIDDKTRWFVANRIDLAGKFGPSVKSARRVLEQLVGKRGTGRQLSKRLDAIRKETILAVLKGVPFADSPCGNELGRHIGFLGKEKYEELLKSCSLEPKVYEYISHYEDWTSFLLDDGSLMDSRKLREYKRPLKVKLHSRGHLSYGKDVLHVGLPNKLRFWLIDRNEKAESYRLFLEKHLPDIADSYRMIVNALDLEGCGRLLDIMLETERLAIGLATPVRIRFKPPKPIFPLTISRINKGSSFIEICVVAKEPMCDRNDMLKVNKTHTLPHRVVRKLAPYLEVTAHQTVTRLSRNGELATLTKDCILVPGPPKNSPFKAATLDIKNVGVDGQAFATIFSKPRPQHGQLQKIKAESARIRRSTSAVELLKDHESFLKRISANHSKERAINIGLQTEIAKELASFIESHPKSRFADDALLIIIDKLYCFRGDGKGDPVRVLALYKKMKTATFTIEPFALLEAPRLSRPAHFISCGLVHEFIKGVLALSLRAERSNEPAIEEFAEAALFGVNDYLAREAAKPRERPKNRWQRPRPRFDYTIDEFRSCLERLRPARAGFDRAFADGLQAFGGSRFAIAEQSLLDAVNFCESRTNAKLASVWFIIGESRIQLGKYKAAIEAYQNMLDLNPPLMDMLPTRTSIVVASPYVAQAQMAVCFLRSGEAKEAITVGHQTIGKLKIYMPGATEILATAYYNLACAYALTGNKDETIDNLAKAIDLNEKYATSAVDDEDFVSLKEDAEFRALLEKKR